MSEWWRDARRRGLLPALALLLLSPSAGAQTPQEPRRVVLLYDERTDLPGLSILDAAIARGLTAGIAGPFEIYREAMDLSRFGSDEYLLRLRDHLRAKYAGRKIDVAVGAMSPSLDFLIGHGAEVFPGASIVFCGIDRRQLEPQPLPSHVTGVLVKRDFSPTLELVLQLHPGTEQIVVVGGTSAFDTELLEQARAEFRPFENRVTFTYLTTLPLAEVLTRVAQLPPQTIVLFTTMFRDGAGVPHVPHDAVERIAATAAVPVYGFVDQYLGRGIVGGHLYSLDAHGEEAARLALRILSGTPPSQLPPVEPGSSQTLVDWRQMQRWGIGARQLPMTAIIRFREPSLWSEYWPYAVGAVALVILQTLIIGSLLVQSARRRRAELAVRRHQAELAHASRLATVGELTAAIAHEVNQPLGAILTNVAAAEILIESRTARLEEVRSILEDVRKDDLRASEVIRRLRTLLAKHEIEPERLDLNETIAEVLRLLDAEAHRREVELATGFDPALPKILADRVHLQQVVLNLVVNAMDAMSDTQVSRRRVMVRTGVRADGDVEVAVSDNGPGIAAASLPKLFDSFFTTKPRGMGLGLSIARSIVDAHGGRIWVESEPGTGATFRFTLPGKASDSDTSLSKRQPA